ncbi:MAG TPA: NAD(P)H-binding protein [Chitinophagales bacterium]|nr:NAD(P)H-binding protein [Chitinophagales bacterium]
MAKTALIIGATGLVGGHCLNELLASPAYDKVIALTRRKLDNTNAKLVNVITDFEDQDILIRNVACDDVFCAMGTTINKAGSKEAFKHVDLIIPQMIARLALVKGAKKFVLVSSIGANAQSMAFYTQVKGQLEEALRQMGYQSVIIFRPSILMGARNEKRTGEAVGQWVAEKFSFLFAGPFKKYAGTPADLVGKKMVAAAQEKTTGVRIIENEEILK